MKKSVFPGTLLSGYKVRIYSRLLTDLVTYSFFFLRPMYFVWESVNVSTDLSCIRRQNDQVVIIGINISFDQLLPIH